LTGINIPIIEMLMQAWNGLRLLNHQHGTTIMRHSTILIGFILSAAAMTASNAGPAVPGDAAKGAAIVVERCSGCHGADGNSPAPTFPNLAGQHAEYLISELKAYQAGQRESELMQPLVKDLTEADIKNISVFFAKQKPAPGTVNDPSLLTLGKKIYLEGNSDTGVPSCDGCHETGGEGTARFPRLAGQSAEYTMEQFRLYAAGKRPHGKRVMRTVAERLSEKEARAVAEYMASLP
jgi:cytochrome c553